MRRFLALLVGPICLAAACSSDPADTASTGADATAEATDAPGVRLISADEGLNLQTEGSDDLVVLDVRTPEEFAEGRIEGAVMVDFYAPDFADQLSTLDPDAPYLLYCRSGNRSGQTADMMRELGFSDVSEVDGGILAWNEAGHPLLSE